MKIKHPPTFLQKFVIAYALFVFLLLVGLYFLISNPQKYFEFSLIFLGLLLIAGFGFGIHQIDHLQTRLHNIIDANKKLAAGDWTIQLSDSKNDEIGHAAKAFDELVRSQKKRFGQLHETGILLANSSKTLASAVAQQETSVTQQEEATREIAHTSNEISATSRELAETMTEVSSTAQETFALAQTGKANLQQMEAMMHQLVTASGTIAQKLMNLNDKAEGIGFVITTMTKVADQTNLLSLNAALEAEKAKEFGKGFAIIAKEIRRLADQTAHATLDIEQLVNDMIATVSSSVHSMNTFVNEIRSGVKQSTEVGELLSEILDKVQFFIKRIYEVNSVMQSQSQGADHINDAIHQLSTVAQQTTSSIKDLHKTIDGLTLSVQDLQLSVTTIKS